MNLHKYIRDVKDFPIDGIIFKDISPLLAHPESFQYCVDTMIKNIGDVDKIVGLDARGFLFAGAIAYKLSKPLVLIRKSGKLPHETLSESYNLEYGSNSFEIHKDSLLPGEKIAIIDDLLATGGTVQASINLVEKLGATVTGLHFIIELEGLCPEALGEKYNSHSLLKY